MKTTVELSDPLLEEAKRVAAREGLSLRALIESGLTRVLKEYQRRQHFELRDASFKGNGLQPEFRHEDWERIREAGYEGRGA
jgi:hypothetical protein